jgi:hypothetical protein
MSQVNSSKGKMVERKKTVITFLMLVSLILGILNALPQASEILKIPIPVLLVIILVFYILWKEGKME